MATAVPFKTRVRSISCFLKDCRWRITWSWFFQQCRAVLVLTVAGTLSYLFISHYIFQAVRVVGPSMYPTLANSGCYWLNRFAYVVSEPKQDDIVALKDPQDSTPVVKRIIATPEQSIYLKDGKVYVDGHLLSEPYLSAGTPTYAYEKSADEFFCIGKDEFFVMGDNRNNSMDSRTFGAVPRQNILGKVME
ncbi:MAG TPA: signal peptidase I [Verrucomicrobiae bacterium]|nr:signal peptidase I [Verrucomicrobiae bacterium]